MLHRLFRWLRRTECLYWDHDWRYDDPFKRTCTKCERHEWAFQRRYPSADHPSIVWRRMFYNKD